MIVGIVGRSEDKGGRCCSLGTGKDTVADLLVSSHDFVKVALADEMKRFCGVLYKFSPEQLWGPSHLRNAVDRRYPREHHVLTRDGSCACCGAALDENNEFAEQCYLTPRYALQTLGSEWGKFCYRDTWVRRLMEDIAPALLADVHHPSCGYDKYRQFNYLPELGLVDRGVSPGAHGERILGLVISDIRFEDELRYIKKRGGKTLLVYRKVDELPKGPDLSHASEVDLNKYSPDDDIWDDVIYNFRGVEDLVKQTQQALDILRGKV